MSLLNYIRTKNEWRVKCLSLQAYPYLQANAAQVSDGRGFRMNTTDKRVLQVVTGNFGSGGLTQIVHVWGRQMEPEGIVFDFICRKFFPCESYIREIHSYGGRVSRPKTEKKGIRAIIDFVRRLWRIQAREKYEIIHIHSDSTYNMLAGGLAARAAGIPRIILHSHSAGMEAPTAGGISLRYLLKVSAHRICKLLLPGKHVTLCACSSKAADWMYRRSLRDRVIILDNGIDLKPFMSSGAEREAILQEKGLCGKLVIGHVGRFAYVKNHKFILQLAADLKKICPHVVFVLVGDGELFGQIRSMAQDAGLDNVIFTGQSNEVDRWLQAFDIFILPSWFEGLPVSAIEAQAAGLPCLLSDRIDRACKVLESVEFLAVDGGTKEWVQAIRKLDEEKERYRDSAFRAECFTQMVNSKYNISNTVRELKLLYEYEA